LNWIIRIGHPYSYSPSTTPLRITNTGTPSLFNGVPDWVYEEEVFSADYALWWSPNGRKLAFLSFDESEVQEYAFPVYNPTEDGDAVVPYTTEVVMKYPKPGTPNPVVSVRVVDVGGYIDDEEWMATMEEELPGVNATAENVVELTWQGRHAANESIVQEVAWVDEDRLLVKEVNRNADDGHVVLFELPEGAVAAAVASAPLSSSLASAAMGTTTAGELAQIAGQVVRRLGKDGEEGDEGWIEAVSHHSFSSSYEGVD
jgi:dipeptidyl aminopeptidase B